jgi:N-acyl-D-aspartate/D-glutamate deacylase
MRVGLRLAALIGVAVTLGCDRSGPGGPAAVRYDLVVANGRVIDPATGLDAIRHVGVQDGSIASISEQPLQGRDTIDASGLVVAPGFIDLHAHGQDERSALLQARDGVTTALDLESGVYPVEAWYRSREGKAPIHFGAPASHRAARIFVKHGIEVGHSPTDHAHPELLTTVRAWQKERASPEEVTRITDAVGRALDDGALGIGLQPAYNPGARHDEVYRVFELAGRRGAPVFVHTRSSGDVEPRSSLEAFQEVLANAAASGAPLHIVHITSSGLRQTPLILSMIEGARRRGLDVSVEAYPYTASSTRLASALFDGQWQEERGISYGDLQWAATGERLTRQTFDKYRKEPGWVIIHGIPADVADAAIEHPLVMVASDGIPFDTGGEHPRGAGSFARTLGRYVRERQVLTLMDALRKMTLMPAQRLETFVPAMKKKGRIGVGSDADLTIFNAGTIADRATFEKPMQPSVGIEHVLVAGTFVVRAGKPVAGAFPGRPVRNDVRSTVR